MFQDNTQALQALALALQISLSFNDDGVCALVLNGDGLITLEGDPQGTMLRMNAAVGVLPDVDSSQALRVLLEANFNGRGTGANSLGIDHVSNEVVLGLAVDASALGPDGLKPPLADFIHYALYWRRNLLRQVLEANSPSLDSTDTLMSLRTRA